jgi:manganese-dependent inorganic pyrophosphatase
MSHTYVIGHINPDTDSIASAVGYAWLLRERDGEDTLAARAGPINPQTTWILKRLEIEAPTLLTDASPRFEAVTRRYDTTFPDSPIGEAWPVINRTGGVAPVVDEETGKPVGMITGVSLIKLIGKLIGPLPQQQEMRVAEIMELPCSEACDKSVPRFRASTRIRDVINRVLREEHNDFLIVDEVGLYLGVSLQRDVLNPPRLRLILVDHNEAAQALGSIEEAELIEILDHHRLGNPSTRAPIRFSVDVVGSTCTLVTERIRDAGLRPPPDIAGLLVAGLVADTLILNSPTTTDRDKEAVETLSRWAFVQNGPLPDETIESFGVKVLEAGAGLSRADPEDIVSTDIKMYEAGGYEFAIAQAEVTNLMQLDEHLGVLTEALDNLRQQRGLDFAMLMVTDIVGDSSRLVTVNAPPILDDLPYPLQSDSTRLANGVVSRKKQLLPVILSLLEV